MAFLAAIPAVAGALGTAGTAALTAAGAAAGGAAQAAAKTANSGIGSGTPGGANPSGIFYPESNPGSSTDSLLALMRNNDPAGDIPASSFGDKGGIGPEDLQRIFAMFAGGR